MQQAVECPARSETGNLAHNQTTQDVTSRRLRLERRPVQRHCSGDSGYIRAEGGLCLAADYPGRHASDKGSYHISRVGFAEGNAPSRQLRFDNSEFLGSNSYIPRCECRKCETQTAGCSGHDTAANGGAASHADLAELLGFTELEVGGWKLGDLEGISGTIEVEKVVEAHFGDGNEGLNPMSSVSPGCSSRRKRTKSQELLKDSGQSHRDGV